MSDLIHRRPRLALPFTILTDRDTVRLVAGEDYRYTFSAPALESWLPEFLRYLQGKEKLETLLAPLTPAQRDASIQIVEQLYGERVLVDGTPADAHVARKYDLRVEGGGPLSSRLESVVPADSEPRPAIVVLCQDRLDFEEALACNRNCREAEIPFLWVSHGAMSRAYVSPLFLPDAGPCFGCLLRSFERLSPAPEIYAALRAYVQQGKPIEPVDFPAEGFLILEGLVRWKLAQAQVDEPDPALYRLHVLERQHFEVSTHRVFADSSCLECGRSASRAP